MPPTRSERTARIVAIRQANPCMTLEAIGQAAGGISRERVRQILVREGLETAHLRRKVSWACMECGRVNAAPDYKARENGFRFCPGRGPGSCWWNYAHPLVVCDNCGVLFRKSLSGINAQARRRAAGGQYRGRNFCNRRCAGLYLARTTGFLAHPENATGRPRKYDYDAIWSKYLETGLRGKALAELTGIPAPIVGHILYTMKRRAAPGIPPSQPTIARSAERGSGSLNHQEE